MNVYKKFLHIIRQHAEALLLYEILMRSIGFLIGSLLVLLFDLSFRKNQGDILINSDLLGFFEGYRLIFLTVAIFAVIYVSLVEIVGLCYISVHEEKGAHILAALRYSAKRSASMLHAYGLHVIFAIFLCVFFFPIFDVGPAYLRSISIPTFVTDEISRYAFLPYAYSAMAIGLFIVLFRSAFALHIFALNRKDLASSIRDSWRITRRKAHVKELLKWGVFAPIIICAGLIALTSASSYLVLSLLNAIAVALISVFPQGVSLVLYTSWIYLLSTAISLMVGPVLISLVSAYLLVRSPAVLDADIISEAKSFSRATEKSLTEGLNVASNGYLDSRAVLRMLRKPALIVTFGAISFLTFSYISSRFLYVYDDKPARPILISHRGTSGYVSPSETAEENSVEAFEAFLEGNKNVEGVLRKSPLGTSRLGIETDLQSLRDGTVIAYHDANFSRIYGIDTKVNEASLADFDAWFGSSSDRRRPALMTELLDFIDQKGVCPALLEIKAYEGSAAARNTVTRTIGEVRKRGLESCVYLGSLDRQTVSAIEEIAPEILSNQYVFTKAGDIGGLEAVDAISLEHSIASERLVRELKRSGKTVFAWTVNSPSIAEQLYAQGVDGVITDNPAAVRNGLESYEEMMSHVDPKVVTLFGKTFLVDLKDVWQFKLRFPFL